jgi:hypothetical protein
VRDIRNVYKILIAKREGEKPPLYKGKDYLQKPIAAQLLKKFPAFLEPEVASSCLHAPSAGHCHEPGEFCPHPSVLVHEDTSLKQCLAFRSSSCNPVCVVMNSVRFECLAHLIFHDLTFHSFSCRSQLEHRAPFGVYVMTHTRHTVGLLWTSDQPVAEAATYTGQHNI